MTGCDVSMTIPGNAQEAFGLLLRKYRLALF
jgi:hypothetical protein